MLLAANKLKLMMITSLEIAIKVGNTKKLSHIIGEKSGVSLDTNRHMTMRLHVNQIVRKSYFHEVNK